MRLRVIALGGVILLARIFEIVRLGSFCALGQHFLDTALCVGSFEVVHTADVFHNVTVLVLGTLAKVLVPHKDSWHYTLTRVVENHFVPVLDVGAAVLHIPVPPDGILLTILKFTFLVMVQETTQVKPGENDVKRVSHDAHHFICVKEWCKGHAPR